MGTRLMPYKYVMMIILLFSFLITGVYYHEKAHEQVALFHGCTNYSIDFGINSVGYCNEWHSLVTDEILLQEASKQSDVENVFYHLSPVVILFASILLVKWVTP